METTNERERLRLIASTLPPEAVEALIAVAQQMGARTVLPTEEDLMKCLAAAPHEEIDEQRSRELREPLAEQGERLTLDQVTQQLGV